MYDVSDPRAALQKSESSSPVGGYAGADYLRFYEQQPASISELAKTWYGRGQNFLVAFTSAQAGAILERRAQPDEYAILLPDASSEIAVTAAGAAETTVKGYSIVFVPAGDSAVRVTAGGTVIRIFSHRSLDVAQLCANASSYAEPQPNTAPLEAWPDPVGQARVRAYSLDVPSAPGRFGRIFRCSTLMVNVLDPWIGPRDAAKMSPHHHDDFQQGSLAIAGEFVHHLRWPWTTDMNQWRDDDHVRCGSPSLAVIPPPSIHTTQAVGEGTNWLVDIFSPPRADFSRRPGWVLNADDYPTPCDVEE